MMVESADQSSHSGRRCADTQMREHSGSSSVTNGCALLVLSPSVMAQCTFMKSSSLPRNSWSRRRSTRWPAPPGLGTPSSCPPRWCSPGGEWRFSGLPLRVWRGFVFFSVVCPNGTGGVWLSAGLPNGSGSCWAQAFTRRSLSPGGGVRIWPWLLFLVCLGRLFLTLCVCLMTFTCHLSGNTQLVLPFWISGPAAFCRKRISLATSWCSSLRCVWICLQTL